MKKLVQKLITLCEEEYEQTKTPFVFQILRLINPKGFTFNGKQQEVYISQKKDFWLVTPPSIMANMLETVPEACRQCPRYNTPQCSGIFAFTITGSDITGHPLGRYQWKACEEK